MYCAPPSWVFDGFLTCLLVFSAAIPTATAVPAAQFYFWANFPQRLSTLGRKQLTKVKSEVSSKGLEKLGPLPHSWPSWENVWASHLKEGNMSAANRAQTSAASEQQHNQENMLTRLRGPLKGRDQSNQENQENQPLKQATNRTVLGVLQNNQRLQSQNQRATKQVGLANDASGSLK